jgi:L-asparaginase
MKRVLLLHTGGTLGMSPRQPPDPSRPLPLAPDAFGRELVAEVPELRRLAAVETRIVCNLDSSDMTPEIWSVLARAVGGARADFDGVVIVHGTDTMAYTAAALSFALVGLDRPVVLTGSQRPLGEVRTDARRNLVDAVDLATRDLPEVGICFDGQLLRGNRATKGDAWSYAAFASPGCAPLARLGLDVELGPHVRRPTVPFSCAPDFDARVAVAYATPAMDPGIIDALASAGARGIVLAAFGVGNVPLRPRSVVPALRACIDVGVTVLAVTQPRAGPVDLRKYESGAALAEIGVVPGGEMGLEAGVVKLMHALARHPADPAARAAYLASDVAGERGSAGRAVG